MKNFLQLTNPVSVAPMLDWTDAHCRYFLRLISRHIKLYTEMITTGAILQGKRQDLLAYDPAEHPLVLQLGGCEPKALAACAQIAENSGYDEINLNVGCPSDRVQAARFGACLMAEPELVAECVSAMRAIVKIPVTVKSRIGIDDKDSYEELAKFIEIVSMAGCEQFIIHARKAWLKGLSPKENREIPPLRYEMVYQLKQDFPHLIFILNGGITRVEQIQDSLTKVDGVMIGRAFYYDPYAFSEIDKIFYNSSQPILERHEILQQFMPYIEKQLARGVRLPNITRHILGLYQGVSGARAWRRYLSENAVKQGAGVEVLENAMGFVGLSFRALSAESI